MLSSVMSRLQDRRDAAADLGEDRDIERDVRQREHRRPRNRAAWTQMVGVEVQPHPRRKRADRLDLMRSGAPRPGKDLGEIGSELIERKGERRRGVHQAGSGEDGSVALNSRAAAQKPQVGFAVVAAPP